MNSSIRKIAEYGQIILGNAICAFAMGCFALPFNMVVAGMSGIGRMVEFYTGISITIVVAVLNIAAFAAGWIVLGRKFAASIVIGSFAFPIFLGFFQNLPGLQHLVDDPLLAAICAGVLDGVGLGLVLRIGGSTGGTDVPAMILNRKLGINIAKALSVIDVSIFLVQLPVTDTNGVILGILYALIYSFVLNRMIVLEQGGIQMMIWTDHTNEVNEEILRLGFGTTLIRGRGGYLRDSKEVILCAAANRSLGRIKRAVLEIDSKAFITISSVNEINGNGFTMLLGDGEYTPVIEDRK